MDLEITSKEKNPFLKRQELTFQIKESITTPTRKDVKQKIAAITNAKEEVLILNKINHKFGSHSYSGKARIYESKEDLGKIEQQFVIVRNFGKPKKSLEQKEDSSPEKPPKSEENTPEKEETKTQPKKEESKVEEKPEKKKEWLGGRRKEKTYKIFFL